MDANPIQTYGVEVWKTSIGQLAEDELLVDGDFERRASSLVAVNNRSGNSLHDLCTEFPVAGFVTSCAARKIASKSK